MSSQSVFRKVSLDRLASPEQLDQLMQVTDARGWIALAALTAVLLTGVAWGVFGSIPEKVSGMGILVKSGGLFEVVPTAGGRVTDVAVAVGDLVNEGQVVVRVDQPQLSDELAQARAALENLRQQRGRALAFDQRDLALQHSYLAQQRASEEQIVAAGEASVRSLRERIASQAQLVTQGLLTRAALLATQQQLDAAREKLEEGRGQLLQLDARELSLRNQKSDAARESEARIADQEAQVAELERRLKASSEVVAPYTGRILELMTERGNVVSPGEPILSLDLTGRAVKDLEAVVYVPSVEGKRIRPGMQIEVAPSTVKQEQYGLMLGRVTYVSDFPATSKGMRRVLKNDKLVSTLAGQDAPYEVHADLIVDPATPSRYRWTSAGGPPLRIQSGTLAVGNIDVAMQRPIELVLPLLRKYTGI